MASAKHRSKLPEKDDLDSSILAKLTAEFEQQAQQGQEKEKEKAEGEEEKEKKEETNVADITLLVCGPRRSGKTAIIDRYINPTKDEKDMPKPTVALDYKFARYESKVLAHIYDLGGSDLGAEDLLAIPISPGAVGNMVLALTVDLSEPNTISAAIEKWLLLLRSQVNKSLSALAKESAAGAKQVEALKTSRDALFEGHADKSHMTPFPVPLIIFGAKWDALVSSETLSPDKRKGLCNALRYFAHVNGASLVFTSLKDKQRIKDVRVILQYLVFGVSPKSLPEQVETSKPICIMAGKDNLQSIGGPRGGGQASERAWRDLLNQEFPDTQGMQRGGAKKTEADQVADDLLQKFAEGQVDGIVEQRQEELEQYRKQVERNQRLASEGVEGAKGILAS